METAGVNEAAGITMAKVLENGEHFKAGLIDFTAGSLGKLFIHPFIQFYSSKEIPVRHKPKYVFKFIMLYFTSLCLSKCIKW